MTNPYIFLDAFDIDSNDDGVVDAIDWAAADAASGKSLGQADYDRKFDILFAGLVSPADVTWAKANQGTDFNLGTIRNDILTGAKVDLTWPNGGSAISLKVLSADQSTIQKLSGAGGVGYLPTVHGWLHGTGHPYVLGNGNSNTPGNYFCVHFATDMSFAAYKILGYGAIFYAQNSVHSYNMFFIGGDWHDLHNWRILEPQTGDVFSAADTSAPYDTDFIFFPIQNNSVDGLGLSVDFANKTVTYAAFESVNLSGNEETFSAGYMFDTLLGGGVGGGASLTWVRTVPSGVRYGRFVLAIPTEYVVVAVRASDNHFLEIHSTDQGDTWDYYDTGVIVNGTDYDAVVDTDGIIHVLYGAYAGGHFITEIRRTAWQTWSAPVTIDASMTTGGYEGVSVACSSSGEVAVAWFSGYLLNGKKWTKANGWDTARTPFHGGVPLSGSYMCKVVYAADGAAIVAFYLSSPMSYVAFSWGGATLTTLVANSYIVTGGFSMIMTGSDLHIAWIQSTSGALPWHVFLDNTQISFGTEQTDCYVLLAQRQDGKQVLYYVNEDLANARGTVRRAELTNGVAGTVSDHIPAALMYYYDYLTCPSNLPNTEGLLAVTGGPSPYQINVSHGIPIVPLAINIVHSFPWVGRFRLCKVN